MTGTPRSPSRVLSKMSGSPPGWVRNAAAVRAWTRRGAVTAGVGVVAALVVGAVGAGCGVFAGCAGGGVCDLAGDPVGGVGPKRCSGNANSLPIGGALLVVRAVGQTGDDDPTPAGLPGSAAGAGAPVAVRTAFPSTPACDHTRRRANTSVLIRSINAGAHTLDATAPRRTADPCPDRHNAAAAARRVATCGVSAMRVADVNAGCPCP